MRYYNVDLGDLWRGTLSVRKAGVLALHLPPDAAVFRIGPDDHLWDNQTQYLVTLIDMVGSLGKKYKNLPRPGDARRQREFEKRLMAKVNRWRRRTGM